MKCNYNLIYKGILVGYGQHKVQEGYEDLSQGHDRTIRDSLNLKDKYQHGYKIGNMI